MHSGSVDNSFAYFFLKAYTTKSMNKKCTLKQDTIFKKFHKVYHIQQNDII